MIISRAKSRAMPARKPAAAIVYDEESIAGSRSDQTEAAIITPAANPVIALPVFSPIPLRNTKTEAEPMRVPRNGTAMIAEKEKGPKPLVS